VAPAPIEEKLQLSPYIAQCVVYGANRPYNVALIVPDMPALTAWAQSQGVSTERDALLRDPKTHALFRSELDNYSRDFKGFESVREFLLEPNELSTANGMLTPTLKVKRRAVMKVYEPRLQALYV
jgi:long-chain acyl-CoA synthetase